VEQVAGNSHNWQWNVSVQHELMRNTVVEVAYVGNRGLDLLGQTNLNEIAPANRLQFSRTGDASLRPLNGIAGIGGNVTLMTRDRDSIYHALQAQLVSRFGRGSILSVAYTLASSRATTGLGNADGPGLSNLNAYTDSTNPDLDYARGAIDRTHVFSGSLIWALPTLEEKGGVVKHIFGDWQFNAIVQTGTGYPITVVTGSVPGVSGNGNSPSGTGNGNNLTRPNRVEGQPCTLDSSDPTQYLNPAAWTLNGYVLGTNGNSGRNICDGPGFFQADASLYKNIKLGSRVKLQLRFEVFNLFNTVNLVGTSMTNGGALTAYNAQNVVFDTGSGATATRIQSAQPVGNFGQMTQARDPRTAQLGIRLSF
jgi:hypothetical protein